jgi:hypothetical protein
MVRASASVLIALTAASAVTAFAIFAACNAYNSTSADGADGSESQDDGATLDAAAGNGSKTDAGADAKSVVDAGPSGPPYTGTVLLDGGVKTPQFLANGDVTALAATDNMLTWLNTTQVFASLPDGGGGFYIYASTALNGNISILGNSIWTTSNTDVLEVGAVANTNPFSDYNGLSNASLLVVDATDVIAAESANGYRVLRCPRGSTCGGSPTILASGKPVNAITMSFENIYTSAAGDIRFIPRQGGDAGVIASGAAATALVTDGTNVYFLSGDSLKSCPASPAAAPCTPTVLATQQVGATALAKDDTTLYWLNVDQHALVRFDKDGKTPPTVIANAFTQPTHIAVNATTIFVVDSAAMKIFRVAK